MSLTIQILTKNNEETIFDCLNSLKNIKGKIQVIDLNSSDKTTQIVEAFKIKPIKETTKNRSELRNKYLCSEWNLYINPHEKLIDGHEEINYLTQTKMDKSFYFKVIQGNIITKEIRLWNNNLKFEQPIFETIKDPSGIESKEGIIKSNQQKINLKETLDAIKEWEVFEPTSIKPIYYKALSFLLEGRYQEFCTMAEHYLFVEKNTMAAIMLKYYLARYKTHIGFYKEAMTLILQCISERQMAEFWCLIGDIYYKLNDKRRAKAFYENAIIIGSQRLNSDKWPMDISKYKEYPLQMIKSITNE